MHTHVKKNKSLVRNQDPAGSIQSLTCNLVPSHVRLETLEDRTYTVVPMVILTEGVHVGSEGPLLYPKEELSKTPPSWDHKPIVVYHPEMNGMGISACNPAVINSRKVGLMMNTRWERGRLKSEAWIESNRADRVDERVMAAVQRNEMMELSTGVFVDMEKEEGEWKGETYVGIARNYRPDHLALLPDKIGACSIKDGAGFLRNQSQSADPDWLSRVQHTLQEAGLLDNEMSHDNIRRELQSVLNARYPTQGDGIVSLWIENVYSNFVIYEKDGKLFRLGYTSGDNGVVLAEEQPMEVKRVTEYRTVEGAFVGNQNQQQEGKHMDKKKMVAAIISNTKSSFTEEDRVTLEAMSEAQLTVITNGLKEEEVPPTPAPAPVANAKSVGQDTSPAPKTPADPAPMTLQSYVAQAPKEIQDVLTNGLEIYNEEKAKLVDVILANKRNIFTKEDLGNRPLGELRRIARLAEEPVVANTIRTVNYAGQGPVPTGNDADVEEALEMPVINFAAAK